MKIALITDGIWPYVMGGMQKHSFYLCKYLAKNKINVDLIHFNQSDLNIKKLDVFTEEEKKYIHSIIVNFPNSNKLPGHYINDSYKHSKLIYEAIKHNLSSYDFLYTKGFTGWFLLEQKQKKQINCAPIGVNFHGYEMFQKAPSTLMKIQNSLLLKKPVAKLSLLADVVFSYGGNITQIIKKIGVPSEKIIESPSGVEPELLVKNPSSIGKTIKFLYLGRYERRKAIEEINKALLSLKNDIHPFEFHFIGSIPNDKKIKKSGVIYHGEIRDKIELKLKISQCDVLVCPSYSEGFPNVILEAMSYGLAIAATDVGAVSLLVNDKNGWVIPSSTSENIAAILKAILLSDVSIIQNKKQNSLKLIRENFMWDDLIKTLVRKIN